MSKTLFGKGLVLTMGPQNEVIFDGGVLIDGDSIAAVGDFDELKAAHPEAAVEDTGGKLMLPGMINTHMHLYSTLSRGMSLKDEAPENFPQILERLWWRLDKALSLDDVEVSALIPLIDCVKKGTTTIIDHHASPHAVSSSLDRIAEAVKQVGLRACLCYETSDRDGPEIALEGIKENVAFLERVRQEQDPMLSASFGLHAMFTVGDETLGKCLEEAARLNCGFHVHVAEDKSDVDYNVAHYGLRAVERLHARGALGPKTICAHCIHVTDEEIGMLKDSGSRVIHNPQSNMNNAVGRAPLLKMLAAGIPVGLGTDGMTASMFDEVRVAPLLHKHGHADPRVAFAEPCMMLFHHNPEIANAFFGPTLGKLEAGAAADLIVMDYDPPTPMTADNLFGHFLFGFIGARVLTTVVAGKVLMRKGELLFVDEGEINARARGLAAKLWERF